MLKVRQALKKPIILLYLAGLLVLLGAGCLWMTRRAHDPQRVFWGMVESGLRTKGVTLQAKQEQNGAHLSETMQFSLGANNLAHSYTVLVQGKTRVVTEFIGTPTANYNRYTSIQTDQLNSKGASIDFSGVRNIWAKTDVNTKDSQASPPTLSQAVFGFGTPIGGTPVPIGSLSDKGREAVLAHIKQLDLYKVNYKDVKHTKVHGRLHYEYQVSMKPDAYVAVMKEFGKNLGLHDLDQLSPDQYKSAAPLNLLFEVDVRSHHLVKVTFKDDKSLSQTYAGYDLEVSIPLPTKTVTSGELQKRLNALR